MNNIYYNSLLVFLGGGLGALMRFMISLTIFKFSYLKQFFWLPSLVVNCLGGILIIFLYKSFQDFFYSYRELVILGFLGSLTTFSSISLEIFQLISRASYLEALLVLILNMVFGVIIGILIFS